MNAHDSGPGQPAILESPEVQKLRLAHSLEVRRLVIDKLLLGAIVGAAAFGASLILERFKQTASDTRFFLEKRLEAGTALRANLSEITGELMGLAEPACELAPERAPPPKEKLETALAVQVKTLNSASLLFSRTYLDDASRVVNIFGGLARYPTHVPCESRQLVSSLADYLTHRTREEVLPGNVPRWSGFVPLPIGIDEIDRMGSVEYAKRNLDRWGASQARR